jgi:hypothetical protein
MTLFLDRVDAVPIIGMEIDTQFLQWHWVLVDTLNEDISDIQSAIMSTNMVTGIAQTVEINSRYIPTNVALTTFQLPANASVGTRVTIAGQGTGGWILLTDLTSGLQTIEIGDVGMSATTSVASSSRYDSIEILCVLANTTWITLSTQTTGFVIV